MTLVKGRNFSNDPTLNGEISEERLLNASVAVIIAVVAVVVA